MLSRLRSSPPTVTPSDICIWPISRAVHLTQGGPITAKDLVSLIRRWPWIPIQLPFKSITEESITCPKGAAHGAWLSGEAAPCERCIRLCLKSGSDKEPGSVATVTFSESGGSSGAREAASMPQGVPGEPWSKPSLHNERHAVLASLHCQGTLGYREKGGQVPPGSDIHFCISSGEIHMQGTISFRPSVSPGSGQEATVFATKQEQNFLRCVDYYLDNTQRQGVEVLVCLRYLPCFL